MQRSKVPDLDYDFVYGSEPGLRQVADTHAHAHVRVGSHVDVNLNVNVNTSGQRGDVIGVGDREEDIATARENRRTPSTTEGKTLRWGH